MARYQCLHTAWVARETAWTLVQAYVRGRSERMQVHKHRQEHSLKQKALQTVRVSITATVNEPRRFTIIWTLCVTEQMIQTLQVRQRASNGCKYTSERRLLVCVPLLALPAIRRVESSDPLSASFEAQPTLTKK